MGRKKRRLSFLNPRALGALLAVCVMLGFAGTITTEVNSSAMYAQVAAIDGKKETPRDRCNNAYIFENKEKATNKARGHLPFVEDYFKERLNYYLRGANETAQQNADELARIDVERAKKAGKVCDGASICGSLFYQDNSGKDQIVCNNRCNQEACNDKLAQLKQSIVGAAGYAKQGRPLTSEEDKRLPTWAVQNPRTAFQLIDAYSTDGAAQKSSAESSLNYTLGVQHLEKGAKYSLDQIREIGSQQLPAASLDIVPPPPLVTNGTAIPGITPAYLNGTPVKDMPNNTGYYPPVPMSNLDIPRNQNTFGAPAQVQVTELQPKQNFFQKMWSWII